MPGGRFSSKVVGPYRTEEVYSNDSGKASSISINALSTDGQSCNTLSLNITDQTITPETVTTLSTNPPNDYSTLRDVAIENNTSYAGYLEYCNGTYGPVLQYRNSSGTLSNSCNHCHIAFLNVRNPIPHPDNIAGSPGSNYSDGSIAMDIPVAPDGDNLCGSVLIDLSQYCGYGGSDSIECLYEFISQTGRPWNSDSYCNTTYNVVNGIRGPQTAEQESEDYYAKDYWSFAKPAISIICHCCGFGTNVVDTAYECCICFDNSTCCCQHSDSDFQPSAADILQGSFYNPQCTCCDIGGSDKYPYENPLRAGCALFIMAGDGRGVACYNGDDGCITEMSSRSGCYFTFPSVGSPNVRAPIKWMTYNHKNDSNYLLWWLSETPDWNGIYKLSNLDSDINYLCFDHDAGDSLLPGYAEKVSDVPASWCSIGALNYHNINAHAVSSNEFAVYVGNYSQCTGSFCKYISEDLVNWELTDSQNYAKVVDDTRAIIGDTTSINQVDSAFHTLSDAGILEKKVDNVRLERTGIVTSNGDKIYAKNDSPVPATVHVWGYTE